MAGQRIYISDFQFSNLKNKSSFQNALGVKEMPFSWEMNESQFPLYALYKEYGILDEDNAYMHMWKETQADILSSREQSITDMSLEVARALLNKHSKYLQSITHLIFIHDTDEASLTLTPVLKLKNKLNLKKTLPFSISRSNTNGFIHALEMMCYFNENGTAAYPALMILADRVIEPQPRMFFDYYPKGDLAVSFLIDKEPLEWEVLCYSAGVPDTLTSNPYVWKSSDFQKYKQRFQDRVMASVDVFLQQLGINSPDWLIPQNLSADFVSVIQKNFSYKCRVYQREHFASCNMLNADCFFSLKEIENKSLLSKGESVCMIFAGPLSQIGCLLLKKK
ncbi:hypothetical protein ACFVRA_09585 [Bacillus subtilis]|uniref:hypothetical protein n=1 Tax=Bacillus subtilis TaxID=1423 RepID=UPI0022E0D493|nr:hypothetical protein [Bacillus subtilis]